MIFQKSTRKNKKYMVLHNNSWIHFGDSREAQYRDSTGLGIYSSVDHNDIDRKNNYLKRAMAIKDKSGNLTYKDKNSANYYSINYLWK